MKPTPPVNPFDQAARLQEANRLPEAEAVYRQILAREPTNGDGLHLLGALLSRMGRHGEGIPLIIQAINGRPGVAEFYRSLGRAFSAAGDRANAIRALESCLALDPFRLPAFAELGNTLRDMGKSAESIAVYQRGLKMKGDFVPCLNGLAWTYKIQREFGRAIELFKQSLKADANQYRALHDIGECLREKGESQEAIEWFEKALRLEPGYQPTYRNYIWALMNIGEPDRALAMARDALRRWPDSSLSANDLGIVLQLRGDVDGAIEQFTRAVAIEPGFFLAHNNLGHAWQGRGELEKAISAYDHALSIEPMAVSVASNRIFALQSNFNLDPVRLRAELAGWDQRFTLPYRKSIAAYANDRSPDRPLRIGYISPDFRDHVVAWNLLPMLEQRDRENFKIHCYSSTDRIDEWTAKIRGCADEWRNILEVNHDGAAEMIRADGIDILVDLALHAAGNRLMVMARKPAPVQVTYLGYAGSTGLPTIDYRLSDPYLDPPDGDLTGCSEETIRLPRSYWCYRPGGEAPDVGAAPSISAGFITFGCLASFGKISRGAQDLWGRILSRVATARLLVYCPSAPQRQIFLDRLALQGVRAERVDFVGWQPWGDYMRTYDRIDVALDPFPWGGGITTCDALYMGVPVVTLAGKTAMGRGGCSVLSNVGLAELIARTPDEYLNLALRAGEWTALRPTLRQRMSDSPLMDAAGFARDLEAIYRKIWIKWTSTNP